MLKIPHLLCAVGPATYNSIGEFARKINVDRGSIRPYINGEKPAGSLYKNEWLLSPINE